MDIWSIIQNDWHKIVVVIAQVWRYFFEYVRPTIKHDKLPQPINIVLPPQGCTITVNPLPIEKSKD